MATSAYAPGTIDYLRLPEAWPSTTPEGSARAAHAAAFLIRASNSGTLDVASCGLTSLPVELGLHDRLERLRCDDNELTTLPPELGQCAGLRVLHCHNNPLEEPWSDLLRDQKVDQAAIRARLREMAAALRSRRVKAARG